MKDHRSLSDAELVRRAKGAAQADLRAFDELMARHERWVLANCRYMTRSADAEDLAQEVFVKAYYGLKRFEQKSQFKTWLQRIKINHCINFIRRRKNNVFMDVSDAALEREPELHVVPDETAGEKIGDTLLKSILTSMNDTLRIPLVLSDVDGLTFEEIAETLGIGLSAAKMRVKRAREEFRTKHAARTRQHGVTTREAQSR